VISFLLQLLGQAPAKPQSMPLLAWQDSAIFSLPTQGDAEVEKIINDYLRQLSQQGINTAQQGIWIQSQWAELANHQGNIPLSGASLSKIATTLAVLEAFGGTHRFNTPIYHTGTLNNGVLQGDLVIEGGGDPLFVWEEAIALGNALNQLGIRQVEGNLIIVGNFAMNFQSDPQISGQMLKQGLNSSLWTAEITKQYQALPPTTTDPQIAIKGTIQVNSSLPRNAQLLLTHQSLTLTELLKQMNIYSNNAMAEMLADSVGGGSQVAAIVRRVANIPAGEIHLINGSGLGVENQISPRAVCKILMVLEEKFAAQSISVTDVFPVAGRDMKGTMQWRSIPDGTAVKTGTLAQVSALAGVIPTKERGLVWFAIQNSGSSNIQRFRQQQDQVLQKLASHWTIIPNLNSSHDTAFLGDPSRNLRN
jgi:D-alanyl-D-alanine carboxypeptidase/D-alanyl-D-alanine-endopeptidase (penicillin-binding protein 4)